MKRSIFFIYLYVSLAFLVSCSNSETKIVEETPSYVLNHDKMSDVLLDLHVIDAAINLSYIHQGSLIVNKSKIQDTIFLEHKVKRIDFDSSVAWYGRHPDELKEIYDVVTEKLNSKHAEAQR